MSKLRWRRARLIGNLRNCTLPNAALISHGSKFQPTSSKMNRLSYSMPSTSVKKLPITLLGAEELRFGTTAPAAQQQAAVDQLVVVEEHHATGAGGGDDVREGEAGDADVGAGAGGRTA